MNDQSIWETLFSKCAKDKGKVTDLNYKGNESIFQRDSISSEYISTIRLDIIHNQLTLMKHFPGARLLYISRIRTYNTKTF